MRCVPCFLGNIHFIQEYWCSLEEWKTQRSGVAYQPLSALALAALHSLATSICHFLSTLAYLATSRRHSPSFRAAFGADVHGSREAGQGLLVASSPASGVACGDR